MATLTTNLGLSKPAVNDAVDQDLWGTQLNTNMDTIDTAVIAARDYPIRSITSTDSLVSGDRNKTLIFTSTGDYTFNLLSATEAGDGYGVTLVKGDSTNYYTITIDGSSNQTIGPSATYTLDSPWDAVVISSKGTTAGWNIRAERKAIVTSAVSYGLVLSNDAGDTDHDINLTAGQRVSTSGRILTLASERTKRADSTWASGDDAGGKFTSGFSASQSLHLFLIQSDADNTVDWGYSTDINCGDIPSGYTNYAYVHSVKVAASTVLSGFTNEGQWIFYTSPPLDVNGSATTTAQNHTMSIPTGERFLGMYNCVIGGTQGIVFSCPDVADGAASTGASPLFTMADGANFSGAQFQCLTSSGIIRSRADNTFTLGVVTLGYSRLER